MRVLRNALGARLTMAARVAVSMPALGRESLADCLRVLSYANLLWLRSRPGAAMRPPPIYTSGVRFRSEPQEGTGVELYQTIPEVIAQGWGDCDDLTGWRCAELLASGERADCALLEIAPRVYHAVVVRADGRTEDVAAIVRSLERR